MAAIENSPMEVTPPDTYGKLREEVIKHRPVLTEVQRNIPFAETPEQLHFTAKSQHAQDLPPPNATLMDELPVSTSIEAKASVDKTSILEKFAVSKPGFVLLWRNPALSGVVFLGGSLLVLAVQYILHGNHTLTFLTGTCYAVMVLMAFNFVRSLVSFKKRSFADSEMAAKLAKSPSRAVFVLATLHDRFLSANSPGVTLKVLGLVWFLSILGNVFSPWTLVTISWFASFTLPVTYDAHKSTVDSCLSSAKGVIQKRWAALGLTRKQKAAILCLTVVSLWLNSSWVTRLVTLFMGLITVRIHLKPAEVEALMHTAEPYTQSVRKKAQRLSTAASDFAWKSMTADKSKAHVG